MMLPEKYKKVGFLIEGKVHIAGEEWHLIPEDVQRRLLAAFEKRNIQPDTVYKFPGLS